jgi:hypothetical protein
MDFAPGHDEGGGLALLGQIAPNARFAKGGQSFRQLLESISLMRLMHSSLVTINVFCS